MQSLDLTTDRVVGNDAMPNFRDLPSQEMHRSDGNAGRRRNPDELSIHSALPESVVHEVRERIERLIRIRPFGAKDDR